MLPVLVRKMRLSIVMRLAVSQGRMFQRFQLQFGPVCPRVLLVSRFAIVILRKGSHGATLRMSILHGRWLLLKRYTEAHGIKVILRRHFFQKGLSQKCWIWL